MITFAPERATDTQIVLGDRPTETEGRAARLLAARLGAWSGVDIAVVGDDAPAAATEIVVGLGRRARQAGIDVDVATLGDDGFALRAAGGRLFVVGGRDRGPVSGAVELLEHYLGFRLYAPGVLVAPGPGPVTVPEGLADTQVPATQFREVYYRHALDPDFSAWHRLDHHDSDWGLWVHTFATLVPPQEHFAAHPEWFALVDGRRLPNGQLCLTNDEVFHVVIDSLRRRIEAEPDKRYWSVSQNDTYGFCTCQACARIDAEEGAHSGSLIAFVNRVAACFPDEVISTLAYQYSRRAPRTLRPADNVLVVLAPIELNRSRPVATDPDAAAFRAELEAWTRVTDHLLIWDYVIQFSNLVSPFPNLRVLQPNLRYFVDHAAVAHFQQGNREVGGEWAELRAYLIAKLLWNPDADVEALMDDFLAGFYGPGAAAPLRACIDRQHDALAAAGGGLDIFGGPIPAADTYLTPELMSEYESLFDRAEAAAARDDAARKAPGARGAAETATRGGGRPGTASEPAADRDTADQGPSPHGNTFVERVRIARLPLLYARLEQAKARPTGELGLFERAGGQWRPRPEILAQLHRFVDTALAQGVTRVTEWHTTPQEYRAQYLRLLERLPLDHLAVGRPVRFANAPSPKYPTHGAATLTDGRRGAADHRCGWLGWEGQDLEAVVDLGSLCLVARVRVDFLQAVGSWIWLPLRLEAALSEDGKRFRDAATVAVTADERRGGVFTETLAIDLGRRPARALRLRAVNRGTCPAWHGGAGGAAWIFADEIVVE